MTDRINASIEDVAGFDAVGVRCGIKSIPQPDLGVIYCDVPCSAAAMFTTNRVQAAPVKYCRKVLEKNAAGIRLIVVNAGNANACTGKQGERDAADTASAAESLFKVEAGSALVMSTGIIGVPLPMNKILDGISEASGKINVQRGGDSLRFSEAIMTTDTLEKRYSVSFKVGGKKAMIGSATKGSGMIHPNMATMLGFIATDVAITPEALQSALREAVNRTFNMLSVDGDRSPNDSVFVLASGKLGNKTIDKADGKDYKAFSEALHEVCRELTRRIATDGEGATRMIEIRVSGATSFEMGSKVARAIANSPLVKTAMFGADPNWGRIICAAGSCGEAVEPDKMTLSFGPVTVFRKGVPLEIDEEKAVEQLKKKEVEILLDLGLGGQECEFWTCDFSYDYVRINADYHT